MFICYPEKVLINFSIRCNSCIFLVASSGSKSHLRVGQNLFKITIIINFGEANIHIPAILRLGLPGF